MSDLFLDAVAAAMRAALIFYFVPFTVAEVKDESHKWLQRQMVCEPRWRRLRLIFHLPSLSFILLCHRTLLARAASQSWATCAGSHCLFCDRKKVCGRNSHHTVFQPQVQVVSSHASSHAHISRHPWYTPNNQIANALSGLVKESEMTD